MTALFKKCFKWVFQPKRFCGGMGSFSWRVSALDAVRPHWAFSFSEVQYRQSAFMFYSSFKWKTKLKISWENHVLKNNVRLNAISYCNYTWNLLFIAMLNLLNNTERILKWWVFHKQKMRLFRNRNGAKWHYWNVLCLSHGENSLQVAFMFDRLAFFWRKNIPLGNSSANMGVSSRLPGVFYFYSWRIPTVVLKSEVSSENRALERYIFHTKSPFPQIAVVSSCVDSLCTVKQLPHVTPAAVELHLWAKWFICGYGKVLQLMVNLHRGAARGWGLGKSRCWSRTLIFA